MTPETIKAARLDAGLTQKQAAERIGVHVRAWQAYERGEYLPTARTWRVWELTKTEKGSTA